MAGRFQKNNGATLVLERAPSKQATPELRRFKPNFYVPVQKPIKSPNLLQKTAQRSFGKRVVESAASAVAKRAPLAVAGPLGDLLAFGLLAGICINSYWSCKTCLIPSYHSRVCLIRPSGTMQTIGFSPAGPVDLLDLRVDFLVRH